MTKVSCKICGAGHYARGWCKSHYGRWLRHGAPTYMPQRPNPEERFWSKVAKTETCWLWRGPARNGYGLFAWRVEKRTQTTGAHRYAYQLERGEIPDGLVIDHLCRVPLCVNPAHLEPVTRGENVLRGVGTSAVNKGKTHCVNGHELVAENIRSNALGHRLCKSCDREKARRRYQERNGPASISEQAKETLRAAVDRNPSASSSELAEILGWSGGYTRRVRASIYGSAMPRRGPCSIEACDRLTAAKGLCQKHYARLKKHGDPHFTPQPRPSYCEVDECVGKHRARGLCASHYRLLRLQERGK